MPDTVNLPLHFTPDEIVILRQYAATARDVRAGAQVDLMAQQAGIDRTSIINLTIRMRQHKLLLDGGPIGRDYVSPLLVESLHALDNQPKPNRREQFTVWVESHWWSIPIIIIGILLGVAVSIATIWAAFSPK